MGIFSAERYDAFFSYASADNNYHDEFVNRFHDSLKRKLDGLALNKPGFADTKINIFVDHNGLPANGNLTEELEEAIRNSLFLFIFIGEEYPRSTWCGKELECFIREIGGGRIKALRRTFIIVLSKEADDEWWGELLEEDERPMSRRFYGSTGSPLTPRIKTTDGRSDFDPDYSKLLGEIIATMKMRASQETGPIDHGNSRPIVRAPSHSYLRGDGCFLLLTTEEADIFNGRFRKPLQSRFENRIIEDIDPKRSWHEYQEGVRKFLFNSNACFLLTVMHPNQKDFFTGEVFGYLKEKSDKKLIFFESGRTVLEEWEKEYPNDKTPPFAIMETNYRKAAKDLLKEALKATASAHSASGHLRRLVVFTLLPPIWPADQRAEIFHTFLGMALYRKHTRPEGFCGSRSTFLANIAKMETALRERKFGLLGTELAKIKNSLSNLEDEFMDILSHRNISDVEIFQWSMPDSWNPEPAEKIIDINASRISAAMRTDPAVFLCGNDTIALAVYNRLRKIPTLRIKPVLVGFDGLPDNDCIKGSGYKLVTAEMNLDGLSATAFSVTQGKWVKRGKNPPAISAHIKLVE